MGKESYELIQESARGSTEAFRLLFEKFQGELFRFASTRVQSREDAIDLVQEAFIDLWKALRNNGFSYSSETSFRSFIYTILRRKLAKHYSLTNLSVSIENIGDVALKEDVEAGETAIVLKALKSLAPEDQEIISLHYFSGLPLREIASMLGKGESAVKVRHHRAIKKLQQLLKIKL